MYGHTSQAWENFSSALSSMKEHRINIMDDNRYDVSTYDIKINLFTCNNILKLLHHTKKNIMLE